MKLCNLFPIFLLLPTLAHAAGFWEESIAGWLPDSATYKSLQKVSAQNQSLKAIKGDKKEATFEAVFSRDPEHFPEGWSADGSNYSCRTWVAALAGEIWEKYKCSVIETDAPETLWEFNIPGDYYLDGDTVGVVAILLHDCGGQQGCLRAQEIGCAASSQEPVCEGSDEEIDYHFATSKKGFAGRISVKPAWYETHPNYAVNTLYRMAIFAVGSDWTVIKIYEY